MKIETANDLISYLERFDYGEVFFKDEITTKYAERCLTRSGLIENFSLYDIECYADGLDYSDTNGIDDLPDCIRDEFEKDLDIIIHYILKNKEEVTLLIKNNELFKLHDIVNRYSIQFSNEGYGEMILYYLANKF